MIGADTKRVMSLLLLETLAFTGCANPDRKALDQTGESVTAAGASRQPDPSRASSIAPLNVAEAASAAPPAMQDPPPPARDADQRWLRRVADRQAVIVIVAHSQMSRHGTELMANPGMASQHDMSADPGAAQDSEHDAELREILALLRDAYQEKYEPIVSPTDRKAIDSLQSLPESTYDKAFRSFMMREHRQELAIIESGLPLLARSDTRALAQRARATHQRELAELSKEAGAQ